MQPSGRITAERALAIAAVVVLTALAWIYLLAEASRMADMPGMSGMSAMEGMMEAGGVAGVATRWTLAEWGYLAVMWTVMMAAMMLPSALPLILLVSRARRRYIMPLFVSGYLVAWTAYSVIAATLQWALHGSLLVSDAMVSASPVLSGGLLVAAGAFQFTPLKDACVSQCRGPLAFLTEHWREGGWGAVRMGMHHGSYCVGCCWALMALLFVLGVMNLYWITALAVLVLAEKTVPGGGWLTRGAGVALMAWGVVVLWG